MKPTTTPATLRFAVLAAALAACAPAGWAAADAAQLGGAPVRLGNVEVNTQNPAKFTEFEFNTPPARSDWLPELTRYIAQHASKVLPAGERLVVTLTDVQLAGRFEPWHRGTLRDARFVRQNTPPTIELRFRLESAQGAPLKQGERRLRDYGFLNRATSYHGGEALAYEKTLIDDWLRAEFAAHP